MSRIGLTSIITAFLAAAAPAALAATDDVKAISTLGQGILTNCTYAGCNLYHHIKLPSHIVVGDRVRVRFGSNPKQYNFPVARIVQDGDVCSIFSQLTEMEKVDKIDVPSCQVTPESPQ
jgi:hypothetical protein